MGRVKDHATDGTALWLPYLRVKTTGDAGMFPLKSENSGRARVCGCLVILRKSPLLQCLVEILISYCSVRMILYVCVLLAYA